MGKPNLFNYATSELSQDAFLCWLFEWAKPELKDDLLHNLAKRLITELSGMKGLKIKDVEIRKQYKNIDIIVIINKTSAILIEDKVHTKNHNDQLKRYAEILKEEFLENDISLIYFKTGDQSNYRDVEKKGYKIFTRKQFLNLLNEGLKQGVSNHIFIDFLNYLTNIENSVNSFKTLALDNWHWESWKGFYAELQQRLDDGEWVYVPQKNGGFLGFWWYWKNSKFRKSGFEFYLQLEQNKLIFKLFCEKPELRSEIRAYYRSVLYEIAEDMDIKIEQYGRIGTWMGVAKLSENYRKVNNDDTINMDETVKTLKKMHKLLDKVYEKLNN